jgi:hypothetical protein
MHLLEMPAFPLLAANVWRSMSENEKPTIVQWASVTKAFIPFQGLIRFIYSIGVIGTSYFLYQPGGVSSI